MSRGKTAALVAFSALAGVGIAFAALRYFGPALVLRLDEDVEVLLRGKIPLRAAIDQQVDVSIAKNIAADVSLGTLTIPLDTSFQVPLDFVLDVPLDTEIAVDDTLNLSARVAIDTVLTERELDLGKLAIPIDTDIFVDDMIAIELTVPIDSEVTTVLGVTVPVKMSVPVKAKVPIRQTDHVRDVITVSVPQVRVPLHLVLPVRAQVPLQQTLRVRGNVRVPVKRRISVPVKQLLHVSIADPLPVEVALAGRVAADLKAELDTTVSIEQAIPAHLGAIEIEPSELTIERGKPKVSQPVPRGAVPASK